MTVKIKAQKIIMKEISEIKPWEKNPKRHNLEKIKLSIRENGYVDPILLQKKTGFLIEGHGRLKAIQELISSGEYEGTKAPCIEIDCDDEKAKALADAYAESDDDPVAIAPPPGLTEDQAHCTSIPSASSTNYQCIVRVGRYVADVHSNNKGDVYQQASAQYLILTKADQNAK